MSIPRSVKPLSSAAWERSAIEPSRLSLLRFDSIKVSRSGAGASFELLSAATPWRQSTAPSRPARETPLDAFDARAAAFDPTPHPETRPPIKNNATEAVNRNDADTSFD